MRYFTSDLWLAENSEEVDRKWLENCNKYNEYFNTIKNYFSKRFLQVFDKTGHFHDYFIEEIIYSANREINLKLTYNVDKYNLKFKKVSSFNFDVTDFKYCILEKLGVGYIEFERLTDGQLKINILCDIKNEIEIVFEKVIVEKQ